MKHPLFAAAGVLMIASAPSQAAGVASTTQCAVHYTRIACPGQEAQAKRLAEFCGTFDETDPGDMQTASQSMTATAEETSVQATAVTAAFPGSGPFAS